ncbi:MAG TPA: oligosaccharide flippase family protein [Candidatus Limnocylindrales bacterium]|nr:oligosaccharide flippase family protein [Candidatus Limnocylindrales bacterium]
MTSPGSMVGLRRLLGNAAWLLVGRASSVGLAILASVVLAARLGPGGFGGYAVMAAVVALANTITSFGTDMALARAVARTGRADQWSSALGVQWLLSAIAVAAIWSLSLAIPADAVGLRDGIRIASLALIPAALFNVAGAGLRGARRMANLAAAGVAGSLAQLVGVWALVPSGSDLGRVAAVLVGAQLVAALAAWALATRRLPAFGSRPRITRSDLVAMVRASGTIGGLGMLGVVYQRAPVFALSLVAGPLATGWFAASARIADGSTAGHVALFGALYPELVVTAEAIDATPVSTPDATPVATPDATRDQARAARAISLGGSIVIAAILVLFGPAIVGLLYGPSFEPAAAVLSILAIGVIPSIEATRGSLELVASGRETAMIGALAGSLATLVLLLAVLVPVAAAPGAAWAVLGGELVQAGLVGMASRRRAAAPSAPSARAPRMQSAARGEARA